MKSPCTYSPFSRTFCSPCFSFIFHLALLSAVPWPPHAKSDCFFSPSMSRHLKLTILQKGKCEKLFHAVDACHRFQRGGYADTMTTTTLRIAVMVGMVAIQNSNTTRDQTNTISCHKYKWKLLYQFSANTCHIEISLLANKFHCLRTEHS